MSNVIKNIFGVKMPKLKIPAPPPQIDETQKQLRDYDEILRRRGVGATILTSETGLGNLGTVNRKQAGGYASQ